MELVWHATTLPLDRRSPAAASLRHFLSTPQAMKLLRSPGAGGAAVAVPPPGLRNDLELTPEVAVRGGRCESRRLASSAAGMPEA